MTRRSGYLVCTFELLEQVLHLPEGHRVLAVFNDNDVVDGSRTFTIMVEGPSLAEVPASSESPTYKLEMIRRRSDEIASVFEIETQFISAKEAAERKESLG